jgi:arylsulfatase
MNASERRLPARRDSSERPGRGSRFGVALVVFLLAAGVACGGSGGDAGSVPDRHSVVLIVVDALRADHVGTYGYTRPTTPNLDSWAERGRVFERAWATSPWTLPSFGSILTGYLPSAHAAGIEVGEGAEVDVEVVAARSFVTLAPAVPTVAERLAGAGFTTGAFVANPFLDPRFGLDRGFTDYDHYDTSNADLRPATEVVDRAIEWIDGAGDEPFFLLVHLFDPHLDYGAPPPFRGRFTGPPSDGNELPVRGLWPIRNRIDEMPADERAFVVAAYDEEIAYVDAELGRFLDELDSRGVLADGLVVLTADHGEEFFEHGGFEHGHSMYEEVLRVPLVLWGAGVPVGREATPVSLIDIAPTIMSASGGADVPPSTDDAGDDASESLLLPGVPLLSADDSGPAAQRDIIAERVLYGPEARAIVRWPYKAIIDVTTSEAKLFDLAADRGEQHDLAAERPEVLADLLARLSDALTAATALGAGAEAELDAELLRRLRALGYIR